MHLPTFEDIQKASTLLKGHIVETPTVYSPYLSKLTGAKIFLKLENLQETGVFKIRGAYVKFKSLSEAALKKGVVAMSAGNHAQAVAFLARKFKSPATIIMPLFTSPTKVGRTEFYGARVILAGKTFDEASQIALGMARDENLTLIHPYDDPLVIAGQGTIGLEMLTAYPDLDVLIVPIGGGGLCSGITIAAKHKNPSLSIYGVEVEGYTSMVHALYGGKEPPMVGATLADGIAVKTPGKLCQSILKSHLKDILVVSEESVERAVDLFACKQNLVVEGAGAVGLAAILECSSLFSKKKIGLVVSGGNIDARLLSAVIMRGEIRDGHLALLQIKVQDVPGVFEKITAVIAKYLGNILEVKHQRLFYEIPIKMAELDITVQTRGREHMEAIVRELEELGFSVSQKAGVSL